MTLALGAVAPTSAAAAAEPVDGAQTVGDAQFPHIGNGGYDALHYDLDIRWSPTGVVSGIMGGVLDEASLHMDAATTGEALRSFSMDFRGLTIDSVEVDGVPATFTRDVVTGISYDPSHKYKLVITPATPVEGPFTVDVDYHGIPERHTDADGSWEGWVGTSDGATFLAQPVGAMAAYPHNNTPGDKASYTIDVNVPDTLTNVGGTGAAAAASNGVLTAKVPTDEATRTTWRWTMAQPMASELVVISIGKYDVHEGTVTLSSGREIPELSFIDSAQSSTNKTTFTNRRAAIGTITRGLEGIYGPYPGDATGVIVDSVPSGINYALETQDRSFFPSVSSFNGNTLTHEIAHQWYGDNVSPGLWTDIWINEGMASYAPNYYNNVVAPATPNWTQLETTYFNSWNNKVSTSADWTTPPGTQTDSAKLYGYQTYTRGAQFWEALHTALRRTDFLAVVRQWQDLNGGTSPRGDELKDLAEEISGRDLDAFWQDWIYDGDKPAWPGKYDLALTTEPGTGVLEPGDAIDYTLTATNVGRVALAGASVEVDLSDVLDDAELGALPDGLVVDGTDLVWTVPTTPTTAGANTATVSFSAVVADDASSDTLDATAAPAAASLGGLCTETCSSSHTVDAQPLTPTADPVVTGTPVVDGRLTAATTGWPEGSTFEYVWSVGGDVVAGATSATFTPRPSDVGRTVSVEVTGDRAGNLPVTRTSEPSAPVARGSLTGTPVPTVVGDPAVGAALSAETGSWDGGASLSYQWSVGGQPVPAATTASYTPVPADVGRTVTVQVTGSRPGYDSVARTSAPTAPVALGTFTSSPTPTIAGTPVVRGTVRAEAGTWDDGTALAYQWFSDGQAVPGATGVDYSPTADDLGNTLTVRVTGTKTGYATTARTSAGSDAVAAAGMTLTPTPTIGGTPRFGEVLSAEAGTWDDGVDLSYQWLVDGVPVADATGTEFSPRASDVAGIVTVAVTGSRTGYASVTRTSDATAPVAAARLEAPRRPTIKGQARVGRTLVARAGQWDDGVTLTYRWLADGKVLRKESGKRLEVGPALRSKRIKVQVTGSRPGYADASVMSRLTQQVR
ncbi:Aminopeptidase N [Nocardioides dokdonensis FR1436]|uniref:Aminopeptidase N n=1 Tax=Nocardioides dokdonensis FR1436 TaxID=1300347 RepID=A0A1A9GK39_9ACTN|nr:M1 family aminopeptidase [Nocardioides dokdonensis]ANH37851.1 Aminopeptidase N [Nocardioides dokdonensis FR1436]